MTTAHNTTPQYPFTAVVGMDDLRLALLLNAVSPAVGGVLVRGEKGTAKSTAVRALSALMPHVDVVGGCRFACAPDAPDPGCPDGPHETGAVEDRPTRMVELPVGASEDRLVGALDIERALSEGVKAFEPGLLADAHRGILYVDEVNLLHDHLVDLLLDAAAMGASYVEREGVSVRHAARFLLVGTMNPEEGELRPQLLDRFGLTVEVAASREPDQRVSVVRQPAGVRRRSGGLRGTLGGRGGRAAPPHRRGTGVAAGGDAGGRGAAADRGDLCGVRGGRDARGHRDGAYRHGAGRVGRADGRPGGGRAAGGAAGAAAPCGAVTPSTRPAWTRTSSTARWRSSAGRTRARTARTIRTRTGRTAAPTGAVRTAADSRRRTAGRRRLPGRSAPNFRTSRSGRLPRHPRAPTPRRPQSARSNAAAPEQSQEGAPGAGGQKAAVGATEPFRTRRLDVPGLGEGADGRRSRARTAHGRTTGARRPHGALGKLHLAATVQAAAPHQRARGRSGRGLVVRRDDLREAVREGREGNLVLFVVDASGSMAARKRMSAVKGAVLSLLLDAYQRRDKIGMITFRGTGAELALPPTSSVEAGAARLEQLPTGGRTPLSEGLLRAHEVLRVERMRDASRRPLLVVVTDGRATGGPEPVGRAARAARLLAGEGTASVVVDCEAGPVRLGLAGELARELQGTAITLDELRADSVSALVRTVQGNRKAA